MNGSINKYQKYLRSVEAQPLWKASLFVILTLILFLFMILSALRPTFITIANLLNQIKINEKLIDQSDNKIKLIIEGNQQVQNIQDRIILLENAVPKTPAFAAWANYLQNLADLNSVKLVSASLNTTNPITQKESLFSPATEISFSVIVSGKINDVITFLGKIQKLPRLTLIEEARMSTFSENSVEMSIKGRLIYLPFNYAQE